MIVDEIVVVAATGRALAGFFAAGRLVRVEFAAGPEERRLGEIVLGRVRRHEEALGAAFVDLGHGASGFLNRADMVPARNVPGEGEALVVQIVREAEGGKGAKVTASVALPGRLLMYCPSRRGIRVSRRISDPDSRKRLSAAATSRLSGSSGGWFLRHAAVQAAESAIAEEADELLSTWARIEEMAARGEAPARLWRPADPILCAIAEEANPALTSIIADDPGVLNAIRAYRPGIGADFRFVAGAAAAAAVRGLEQAMDGLLAPEVPLAGGGVVRIVETPALVAIDVDVSSHRAGGSEANSLAVNLEAAAAIAGEIRRRDLSGHIVIDFVAMRRQAHRGRVIESLRQAFAGDQLETHVAGYTRLGKVELTRRRVRPSLKSRLCVSCAECGGSGSVLAPEAAARQMLRLAAHDPGLAGALVARPAVAAALLGSVAGELAAIEARLGCKLKVTGAPSGQPNSGCLEHGPAGLPERRP